MRTMTDGLIILMGYFMTIHTALVLFGYGPTLGLDPDMGLGEIVIPLFETAQAMVDQHLG